MGGEETTDAQDMDVALPGDGSEDGGLPGDHVDDTAPAAPVEEPKPRVSFYTYYDPEARRKELEDEAAIVRLVKAWDAVEAVPCPIQLSLDNGYRCFIYPDNAATDQQKYALLAWLVRRSGKRFFSFFRADEQRVAWWNANHCKGAPTDNQDIPFEDGKLHVLFLLEHAPKPPHCEIVTETKTVQVRTLKCSGVNPPNPDSPAGVATPETSGAPADQVPL